MSKTRIDYPDPSWGPCVAMIHAYYPFTYEAFPFHVIAFWDAPHLNFFDALIRCPGGTDEGWDGYPAPSIEMLDLARVLLADRAILLDLCPVCNARWGVSRSPRWNLRIGRPFPPNIPVCPWNSVTPYQWTPDQWPPVNAF